MDKSSANLSLNLGKLKKEPPSEWEQLETTRKLLKKIILGELDLNNAVTSRSLNAIYEFALVSDENQKFLLDNGLMNKLDNSIKQLDLKEMEMRTILFNIITTICTDDKARRSTLRINNFILYVGNLMSVSGEKTSNQFNLNILLFLEEFIGKVEEDGIDIGVADMMVNSSNSDIFCSQMSKVNSSVGIYRDNNTWLIKELCASLACQFAKSSAAICNAQEFLDSLLVGVLDTSYAVKRRKSFFVGISNVVKNLQDVISAPRVVNLLKCLTLPESICKTWQVLDVVINVKDNIVGVENAKKVVNAIHPIFTKFYGMVVPPEGQVDTSQTGPLYRLRQTMEILCNAIDSDSLVICKHIKSVSNPSIGVSSLTLLNILIKKNHANLNCSEKLFKNLTFRFHTHYVKEFKITGENGTVCVMCRVLENCEKGNTTREDTKSALAILNLFNTTYSVWF